MRMFKESDYGLINLKEEKRKQFNSSTEDLSSSTEIHSLKTSTEILSTADLKSHRWYQSSHNKLSH